MDTGGTPALAIDNHRSLLAADVAGGFSFGSKQIRSGTHGCGNMARIRRTSMATTVNAQ